MEVPGLRSAYFDALLEAAALATEPTGAGGTGWLEFEIQRQRRLIASSLEADVMKPFPLEQVERTAATLVEFARWRPGFVRCQVARLTTPAAASATCP
jgi:hypothetical protein